MAKRKRSKKNKKLMKEEKRRFLIPDDTKRIIIGVIMFVIAVLIVLAFFNKAGIAGRSFMKLILFLFGKAGFLLPLLFVLAGLVFFSFAYQRKTSIGGGILVLILGITGVLGILDFYQEPALNLRQGGWFGFVISWPLFKLFGFWAGLIIFGAIVIIGGLIFWHPLYQSRKKMALEKGEEKPSLIRKIFGPKFKVKEIEPVVVSPTELQQEEIAEEVLAEPRPGKKKKELVLKPTVPAVLEKAQISYQLPPLNLLELDRGTPTSGDIRTNSAIIKRTLENFDIPVEMAEINIGPTVTQYTLKPAEGIKLSKITGLGNDLSLALAAHPIRIEAPIPGRSLVGIEVPNRGRAWVRLRKLLENPDFQSSASHLTITLGRDVSGNPLFADLDKMPHLLVAGSTGSGKTICLNSMILSLLYKNSPEILGFILVDPKRVEFPVYKDLPHLLCPVIYDAQKTVNALKWLIGEMERRFDILSASGTRDIKSYNERARLNFAKQNLGGRTLPKNGEFTAQHFSKKSGGEIIPYIVLIIDELADLMAARGREIEAGIVRLAQMARAVGIHLIVATQRPSVEVITGLIKANITSRITFQVASQVDSRTVLDMAGAEKLLGNGDMLFISSEIVKPRRIQGAYVSEQEVKKVVSFIKSHWPGARADAGADAGAGEITLPEIGEEQLSSALKEALEKENERGLGLVYGGGDEADDLLYQEAKKVVIEARKASASLLQRRLRIGYARAARLLDMLEEKGVVGPGDGAKPREVYIEGLEHGENRFEENEDSNQ